MKKWISYIIISFLLFAAFPSVMTSAKTANSELSVSGNNINVVLNLSKDKAETITSLHFQMYASIKSGSINNPPSFTFSDTIKSEVKDAKIIEGETGNYYLIDIIISGKKDQFIFTEKNQEDETVLQAKIGTLSLSPTTSTNYMINVGIVDNTEDNADPVIEYVTNNGQSVQTFTLTNAKPITIENSEETPTTPIVPPTPENPSNPSSPSTPPTGNWGGSGGIVTVPEIPEESITSNTPSAVTPETPATPSTPTDPTPTTPAQPDTDPDKTTETNEVNNQISIDNAKYKIISSTKKKKEVAYIGIIKKKKNVTIPSSITIDDAVYTVTEIANRAFAGNNKLTSISIPATVTKIGNSSFQNCKNLNKIVIPKKVKTVGKKAFYGCKSAVSLTFKGNKVTTIKEKAFMNDISIKKISIPNSVKRINKKAFKGCKSLKTIIINSKKITIIGNNTFKGISKKSVIKVPAAKQKRYTKLLKNSGYQGTIKNI